MNILANYNWIKEYLKTDVSAEDFAREMSLKSMSVESIEYLKDRFVNMVIGIVDEIKDHPDADKLKVAVTNIGSEQVEIVCGGQNLSQGMRVVVALPGSKVLWHGEGDWVELKVTKVRGVESFGMICAPSELGFEKAPCPAGGIWDLSEMTSADTGTPFVEAMDLDDVLFDIEVTSNRVDSMSIVGLAREGGVVAEGEFEFKEPAQIEAGSGKELTVKVEDSELCPRYMAVVIDGVKVGPSPLWLQNKILLSGHRPINNIVDITNYILHEYGQPLHAFDYDKLDSKTIVVRKAREGEEIDALDENTYELKSDQLVIADASKPVAVAGVMGGAPTGTEDETVTVVFEAATFDPISVRRTSRALNLYSDSQLLFEKGLSVESPEVALRHAVELTLEVAGGQVASEVYDVRVDAYEPIKLPWRAQKTRDIMGVDLTDDEMVDILTRLGFKVERTDGSYEVEVPFWRDHDITDEIDFTEEIARVYGYHNIKPVLPDQMPPSTFEDPELKWEDRTRKVFAANGYAEFYGYSFVSADDLARYDLDPTNAVIIHNPLSSEMTHMRTSLIPSVLKSVELNQGEVAQGQVFELQREYKKKDGDLPDENTRLVFGEFGVKDVNAAFLRQKGALELWASKVGLELTLERIEDDSYWHPTRSAAVMYKSSRVGTLGQVAQKYQDAFGIERPVVLADIDFEKIVADMAIKLRYEPSPEFPAMVRDVAIEVASKVEFSQIEKILEGADELLHDVTLKEVYQGDKIEDGRKSVTLSLTIRSDKGTLSSEQADAVIEKVSKLLVTEFGAVIR